MRSTERAKEADCPHATVNITAASFRGPITVTCAHCGEVFPQTPPEPPKPPEPHLRRVK